jgi:hypothetical protein
MKSTTFALLTAACAFTAQAQAATADIMGKVVDVSNNGIGLAGAVVTFEFNPSIKDTTDEQGNFHLSGDVVGVRSKAPSSRGGMVLERGAIRLDVATESRVSVEVYSLDSRRVKTLVDRRLGAGAYSLQNPVADLPAGVYTVRARLGGQAAAVKVTSMGLSGVSTFGTAASTFARLAKTAANDIEVIDIIHVTKPGYRKIKKEIVKYDGTLSDLEMSLGLKVGDLELWSEQEMSQVDWGHNVNYDAMVWDSPQTKLDGEYKIKPFEGLVSWKVSFQQTQTSSLWGFATRDNMDPEDMTAWKDGHMHIAIKGTARTSTSTWIRRAPPATPPS